MEQIKAVAMGGNGRFDGVQIMATRISSLDESIFAGSHVSSLKISDVDVQQVLSMAFHRSRIDDLEIVGTRIGILEKHVISESRIRTLSLRRTIVRNIKARPFVHSEINELQIVGCSLKGIPTRQLFLGLTPTHLHVINNTFDCDADDCEANSMLLKPPRHDLLWKFEGNSCRNPLEHNTLQKTMCTKPSISRHAGFICRLSWAMADCVCTGVSANLPYINVSVIIIGDCEQLTITEAASASALYLFRIGRCDMFSIPRAIKALKVYHSNIVVHKTAMKNSHYSVIALSHTNIHRVLKDAMFNVSIDELIVDNSIMNWHPEAAVKSQIQKATISESKVATVTSLLQIIAHLRITNSVLFSVEGLYTIKNLYLSNITVLCCCGDSRGFCKTNEGMLHDCALHFGRSLCDVNSDNENIRIPNVLTVTLLIFTMISIV